MSSNRIILIEAMEILKDGQWHNLSEFMGIARKHVTPENAYRSYMGMFRKKADGNRGPLNEVPHDQAIAKGRQRRISMILTKCKKVVGRNQGFNRQYKLAENE